MSTQNHKLDDLGGSLKGLTASVEQTMVAVHSLNVYILNSHTLAKYQHEFPTLRHSLKHHWIGIAEVLQQLCNVIDQLVFLGSSIENESDQECIAFLKELDEPSNAASIGLRAAITRNDEILTKFESSSSKSVLQRRHNGELMVGPELIAPPVSPGLSSETSEFVRNSLAAANPAGAPSAIAALSSLKDTRQHLTAILQFWTTLQLNFRAIFTGITQNYGRVLEEKFKSNLASWKADRQDLRDAVPHILRYVDAISIEALPTARRSSSYPFTSASKMFKSALVNAPPGIPLLTALDSRPQIMRAPSLNVDSTVPGFANAGSCSREAPHLPWWKKILRKQRR